MIPRFIFKKIYKSYGFEKPSKYLTIFSGLSGMMGGLMFKYLLDGEFLHVIFFGILTMWFFMLTISEHRFFISKVTLPKEIVVTQEEKRRKFLQYIKEKHKIPQEEKGRYLAESFVSDYSNISWTAAHCNIQIIEQFRLFNTNLDIEHPFEILTDLFEQKKKDFGIINQDMMPSSGIIMNYKRKEIEILQEVVDEIMFNLNKSSAHEDK